MDRYFKLIIEDEQNNLPLQSMFWELIDGRKSTEFRKYVQSEKHSTKKYEPYTFYKIINQLF